MSASVLERVDTSWAEALPQLDELQAGTLHHIRNLANRYEGDWSGMLGTTMVGEDFGALRFQIAYMSYALALTHAHRLPAAPGLFRKPMQQLMKKMLHPDCWSYWSNVSTGNGMFNKELGVLPQQWDPVADDNIMYSAYVQSMALIYHYLLRDDKYAQPESLVMELRTKFWHEGGFRFPYDEKSLNSLIYWQMAETGFLGVACEPDTIFQICNQPNIIGFRMHDMIYGGNLAKEASEGYVKAWEEFGLLEPGGNFTTMVKEHNREVVVFPVAAMNFWLMTLLHSWYPDVVEEQWPIMRDRFILDGPDGTKFAAPFHIPNDPIDIPLGAQQSSWAACCAAEVGDAETLDAMLRYADKLGGATWQDGGYFYKRCDESYDADGNYIGMDVASGNALFALARMNVKDGFKKLYEGPFDDQHFLLPALDGGADDIDILRAHFDRERNALVLTIGAAAKPQTSTLKISLPDGRRLPTMIRDGAEVQQGIRVVEGGMEINLDHQARTTLVLQW